jgi:hypothetical protein
MVPRMSPAVGLTRSFASTAIPVQAWGRFDTTTGAFLGAPLVTAGSGGLDTPTQLLIIPSAAVPEPSALSLALTALTIIAFASARKQG